MLKALMEVWPLVVFTIGTLIGVGKILTMIKTICDRLDGHDKQCGEVGRKIESIRDDMKLFITEPICNRCRDACEKRNAEQFREIKILLTEINDKRDDYVAALGDVSCRLGRIEGKLEK